MRDVPNEPGNGLGRGQFCQPPSVLSQPRTRLGRAVLRWTNSLLRTVSPLVSRSGFYLQGQMDIHPRSVWHSVEFAKESGGFFIPGDSVRREIVTVDAWDQVRRDMLVLLLRSVVERNVAGSLAEVGVWKGFTARLMHHYVPERQLHLFDTFSGFDKRDVDADSAVAKQAAGSRDFSDTSVKGVVEYVQPVNGNVLCHPGYFPESIPQQLKHEAFAFVHLDVDLQGPMEAGLKFFYERVSIGGFIVVHDYNAWPGARKAVDDFCRAKGVLAIPMPDKSGSALIVKG